MTKSSSERIAEQQAERWRKRVVEQDAEILRLKDQIILLARTCEHLLQQLQQAGVTLNEAEGMSGER